MITSVDHEASEFLRAYLGQRTDAVITVTHGGVDETEASEQMSLALAQVEETIQRFEIETEEAVEEFDSPAPTAFVIFNVDKMKFFHGETPSGRPVFHASVEGAQVFNRESVEVGKLHGISMPAPWHVFGGAR